jgi:hypothetical protein
LLSLDRPTRSLARALERRARARFLVKRGAKLIEVVGGHYRDRVVLEEHGFGAMLGRSSCEVAGALVDEFRGALDPTLPRKRATLRCGEEASGSRSLKDETNGRAVLCLSTSARAWPPQPW